MTKWLATKWVAETRHDNGITRQLDGPFEIALESDYKGEPIMVREGITFLLGLPEHLARVNSIMHFNYYDDSRRMIEVWEGTKWIGNLRFVSAEPMP